MMYFDDENLEDNQETSSENKSEETITEDTKSVSEEGKSDEVSDEEKLAADWGKSVSQEGELSEDEKLAADWEKSVSGEGKSDELTDDEKLAADWEKSVSQEEELSEDDKLAAEWAVAGDDENERALSQNEIDSLLGISQKQKPTGTKQGIKSILTSDMIYYERLPMLEVVFDRLIRMLSTSLRNFTSDNVDVSLEMITSSRFGDYLNSIPLPAMISVFKADEWENFGLVTVDSPLIYSIVDVLLGGRKGNALMRIEGRPYTTIERNLVERLVHVFLNDLSNSFDPITAVNFRFERLEINPRFAAIARPGNAAILIRLRIEMDEKGGKLELLLPYATLEPVRELLLQNFMGEKFGHDSIWESHLTNQLWQTDMTMDAVLDTFSMKLRDIMDWKEGTVVPLNASQNSSISLRCGEKVLFSGKIGKKNNHLAMRIDKNFLETFQEEGALL